MDIKIWILKHSWITIIFFILALLSLLYFIVIVFYSGFSTEWCFLWLFLSLALFGLGYYFDRIRKHNGGLPRFIPIFLCTSVFLFFAVFIVAGTLIITFPSSNAEYGHTDYLVVMGERINKDRLSLDLRYRLDETLNFAKNHPETTLLIMGGEKPGEATLEALTMYNYLDVNGVPTHKMIINNSLTNADDRMEEASRMIENETNERKAATFDRGSQKESGLNETQVYPEDYVPTVAILTSDYQMLRIVKLGEHFGIENASLVTARSDAILLFHHLMCESIALVRDFLLLRVEF